MKAVFATAVSALVAVGLHGCGNDSPAPAPGPTPPAPAPAPVPTLSIVDVAQSDPRLSTLVSLLISNNLTETLSGPGPFTVFAPHNDAFPEFTQGGQQDVDAEVLMYHVVEGEVTADTFGQIWHGGSDMTTLLAGHVLSVACVRGNRGCPITTIHPGGTRSQFAPHPAGSTTTDAALISADHMASNGVVHIVNAVLAPDLSTTSLNFQVV